MTKHEFPSAFTPPSNEASVELPSTAQQLADRWVQLSTQTRYLWDADQRHHKAPIANVLPFPGEIQVVLEDGEMVHLAPGKNIQVLDRSSRKDVRAADLDDDLFINDYIEENGKLFQIREIGLNQSRDGKRVIFVEQPNHPRFYSYDDDSLVLKVITERKY